MRIHRISIILATLALFAPAIASAQEPARATAVFRYAQRGTLGIFTQPVPPGSPNARQQHIVDVVEGSPAAKAGVMKGDTLLSINDLAASHQVMSLPFEPGDTVVLRVRRDGRERDITVVAGARTDYRQMLSDSIGERISIVMNRLRSTADTLSFPRMRTYHLDDDSTSVIIIGTDTISTVRMGPGRVFSYGLGELPSDSVLKLFGRMQIHADSLGLHADTLSLRFGRNLSGFYTDSLTSWHFDASYPRILGDSANFRLFSTDSAGAWKMYGPDSTFVRGFDMLTTTATLGMRAVAGAELAPLNPGLSEYFGATEGVLVLNAREGTPAAQAGLRSGDVIVRVGDTAVRSINELRRAVGRAPAGAVSLGVLRRGQSVTVTLDR